MQTIFTVIGFLLLIPFAWIALYIVVFTVSVAWHQGIQKTEAKENKRLKDLATEMGRKVEQLSGEIKSFLEGVNSQENSPRVH